MRKRKMIDSDDKALAVVEDGAAWAADGVRETYQWGRERCESPIERLLLAQLIHPATGNDFDLRASVLLPPSGAIEHVSPPPIEGLWIWPQIKIGPYRVDFVLATTRWSGDAPSYVIVECDGHDFHEKTKDQARRDKARDRYLTGRGFRILRFTGSEIFRDPAAACEEILKVLLGLCDE